MILLFFLNIKYEQRNININSIEITNIFGG